MPEHQYINLSREGKILIICINNPPHNYLPTGFFSELYSFMDLMLSPDVHAIIFTGKGNVFSKGVDIKEITSKKILINKKTVSVANNLLTSISRMRKPVIAAINGTCLGGGLELALACHLRICTEKARLGLPEVSIGLIPGLGGIERLTRIIGKPKAIEMILLGDIISASQALQLNLVNRVFEKNSFMEQVIRMTKTILSAQMEAIKAVLHLSSLPKENSQEENISNASETFIRLLSGDNK